MTDSDDTKSESIDNNDRKVLLIDKLANLIDKNDIDAINEMQKNLLNRFEKSNQMMAYCNELSNQHYLKLSKDFRSHTSKLNELHKDLDSIFHRIRVLKQKVYEKHGNIPIGPCYTKEPDENPSPILIESDDSLVNK